MTSNFYWYMSDLVVLFFKWRLNDYTLIKNHISSNEYFCQVSSKNNFLLYDNMVINFDIIGRFDKTLFTDKILWFGFEVIFLWVINFLLKNIILWIGLSLILYWLWLLLLWFTYNFSLAHLFINLEKFFYIKLK